MRTMYRLCTAILGAVFALYPVYAARAGDDPASNWNYRLGRGLRLGDSGLWLGGYASARLEDYRHLPWRAQLSDLSLFVGWEKGAWRFFSEFELGDGLQASNGQAVTTHQGYFDLERLYLDYIHDDPLQFRVGKFLTPIGRWNLIHADPLVWTTSSPMVVDGPFAMHTTGGMVHGAFNALQKTWNYFVYAGSANELDFKSTEESRDANFGNTLGFRINHELPGRALVGFSYAHYHEKIHHRGSKDLLGLDVFWTRKRYELSGEFIYRFGGRGARPGSAGLETSAAHDDPDANPNQWGLYLQGVAPVLGNLFAVARYEAFQREGRDRPAHLWIGGLAYRPQPGLVFKMEYGFAATSDPIPQSKILGGVAEGFAASIAVLF